MTQLKRINGSEKHTQAGNPENSLIDFYHAFNNKDIELMEHNWLQSDEASMSNPVGGIKRGWTEIKNTYANIFNGPADVFVEFYDFSIHQTGNMFFAAGREKGCLKLNGTEIELAIRTSRIYRKQNNQWKQIHHHGSIDQAELLGRYQSIILQQIKMD